MKLSPSILTADWSRLGEQIRAVEAAGVEYIHLDVMDGHFVPNLTLGPLVVAAVRAITTLPLDVHLMIEHPESYVRHFADAGATILTVHQEACTHLQRQLTQIRELGCKAGVALNPATPLVMVDDVLPDVDQVLVMTVNPGFGSQTLIPQMVGKVRRMRALLDAAGSTADLEVDGGIHAANIARIVDAGATVVVAGSAIYTPKHSVAEAVRLLRTAAHAE